MVLSIFHLVEIDAGISPYQQSSQAGAIPVDMVLLVSGRHVDLFFIKMFCSSCSFMFCSSIDWFKFQPRHFRLGYFDHIAYVVLSLKLILGCF